MMMTVKWLGEEGKTPGMGCQKLMGYGVVGFERRVVSVCHGVLETQQGKKGIYTAGQ